MVPRLLVFDLDGTLVDSLPDLTAALNRRLAARDAAPPSRAAVAPMMGDGARALMQRGFAARGLEASPDDIDAFLADYSANAAVETRLYPGVADTLRRLADAAWRFAICTNKPAAATLTLLTALGAADWFAAVGAGDSFATKKPDPAHLLATVAAGRRRTGPRHHGRRSRKRRRGGEGHRHAVHLRRVGLWFAGHGHRIGSRGAKFCRDCTDRSRFAAVAEMDRIQAICALTR